MEEFRNRIIIQYLSIIDSSLSERHCEPVPWQVNNITTVSKCLTSASGIDRHYAGKIVVVVPIASLLKHGKEVLAWHVNLSQLECHTIRGYPLISLQEGVGTSGLPSGFYGIHGFQCTQNEEVCHRIHMDKINVPCF